MSLNMTADGRTASKGEQLPWQYAATWTRRPASLTFSDTESLSRKSKKCWPLRVRIGRDEKALASHSGVRDRGDISGNLRPRERNSERVRDNGV